MSLFKSNNAFYQSDPDFSNDDSEPRLREQVDPYKVRQLLAEENKSRQRAPPRSSLPPQVKKAVQPPAGDKIIEYQGIDQEDDFYFA